MKKLLTLILLSGAVMGTRAQSLPYQNPALTFEQRADDLLSRLTLEEKVALMQNGSPAIPRLGIPAFEWWSEALHGVGRNGFATVFPITMGMAASFNDALLQQVFTAVSDEARAKNTLARQAEPGKRYQGLSFWTPNINIFRDPRWGRGQETYGEDPYLTTRMGLAVVRGLQGPADTKYRKLLACAKHFAVHSGPEWNRHEFNLENVPSRDLWETYLPAFKALVQEGNVAEVMCAYQRIDGSPCCGNDRYERQILRDEWGFKGLITSDCGAISDFWVAGRHGVSKDAAEASALAVRSGTDVECGSNYKALPEAVRRGEISERDIDTSLRRLLVARFELGDLDPDSLVSWTSIPMSVVNSKAHRDLARQMARQSIVLLQNRDNILPLSPAQASDIVVMGPNANDSVMMWGNYSGYPVKTVTILEGIRAKIGPVPYIQGCTLTRSEQSESRFAHFRTPDGRQGMRVSYWNNTHLQGRPVATATLDHAISQSNGGATVFAPGVPLEQFSARYEGTYTSPADETISLGGGCDDGVRLIVDGDTITDMWRGRARVQRFGKELHVKAGQKLRVQIDYFQGTDMAYMQFDVTHKSLPTTQELVARTGKAQTVIFVGGISPSLEGEEMKVTEPGFKGGDRLTIELPQAQRDLIAALHRAGKRVILVNCSGSAMGLLPETQHADAILQAWYGGEEGGTAVADVLFGTVNPSGKLPVTFYRSTDDLPDFEDYAMKGRTYRYFGGKPLFPFGYGQSYTTFALGQPSYADQQLRLTVKNVGRRAGEEVVQVYLRRTADTQGPIKTLKAFRRVALDAGQTARVTIDLPRSAFEGWDEQTQTMRVVPGDYEVMVGRHSADPDMRTLHVDIR